MSTPCLDWLRKFLGSENDMIKPITSFLNYDQREQNFDARAKFLDATNGKNGQCPKLPIPATVPILNRCIPKNVGSDAENVGMCEIIKTRIHWN